MIKNILKFTLLLTIGIASFSWSAFAQTLYASEDVSLFGHLSQRDSQITAVVGNNGCNPTSWVNAFNYLQNVNSNYFGSSLVGTSYQDWINADLTLSGPNYLKTTATNGTQAQDIIPGLQNFFGDRGFSGLSITKQLFPTINQLYQNLTSQSATQLLLAPFGNAIGHAVTLGAINWDALNADQNFISFVDPAAPTNGSNSGASFSTARFVNYSEGEISTIAFNFPGTTNGYYIQSAFVVAVPGPSAFALLGIGPIGMLMVRRRRTA